jgi:hypothetical protein
MARNRLTSVVRRLHVLLLASKMPQTPPIDDNNYTKTNTHVLNVVFEEDTLIQ